MLKILLCLFVAAVVGGIASVVWWAFDESLAERYLLLPPSAVFAAIWLALPEERPRRARRR